MQRSAKLTLTALILVCTLPVVASYVTFYFWQPSDTMNYGELIGPTALPPARNAGLDGQPDVDLGAVQGRWALVYAGSGRCGEECAAALYAMRQTWLAQGEEMRRVDRLWLLTDDSAPAPDQLTDQRGLKVAQAAPEWLTALPEVAKEGHIYLVDPLGNVMMRFPAQPDVKRMIKDLQRLLKYSRLG